MCRSRLHPNVGRRLPSEQHVGTTDRYGPCRHRHATRFRIHLLQSGSYGFPKVAVRLLGRHDRYHLKCALPKSADRRERLQSRSRREIAELRHTIACLFQLQTLRALGRRSGLLYARRLVGRLGRRLVGGPSHPEHQSGSLHIPAYGVVQNLRPAFDRRRHDHHVGQFRPVAVDAFAVVHHEHRGWHDRSEYHGVETGYRRRCPGRRTVAGQTPAASGGQRLPRSQPQSFARIGTAQGHVRCGRRRECRRIVPHQRRMGRSA